MVLIAIVAIPIVMAVALLGPGLYRWLTKSAPASAQTLVAHLPDAAPPSSATPPGLPQPPVDGPTRPPDDVRGQEVQKPFVDERNENSVIVRSGDTLFDIVSKHYGDQSYMNEVLVANPGLNPSHLRPGQKIVLPPKATLDRRGQSKAAGDDPKIYVVKDQDSLISIARHMYGDSAMANEIFKINRDLLRTPEALRPGMRLRLPPPPQY